MSLRVWIGDLADYNNGLLRGQWWDPTEYVDAAEFEQAVSAWLAERGHEEYLISDVEAPDRLADMVGEYASLGNVFQLAEMLDELGNELDPFLAWVSDVSGKRYLHEVVDPDALAEFREQFRGEAATPRDHVREEAEEAMPGLLEQVAQCGLQIDWDARVRNHESGAYFFVQVRHDLTYVFTV